MKKLLFFVFILISNCLYAEDIDVNAIQNSIDNFRNHAQLESQKSIEEKEAMDMIRNGQKDYLFLLEKDK